PSDKSGVFGCTPAVVEAADLDQIQRFPDVLRRTFRAGVGGSEKTFGTGLGKHTLELAQRMDHFSTVQPHGEKCIAVRHGLVKCLERLFFWEMAQEAENQATADAQQLASIG